MANSELKKFSKVVGSTNSDVKQVLARNLEQLEVVLQQLTDLAILDGRLIEAQAVVTTTTEFNHKLGRQPRGWWITDQDTNSVVWRTAWSSTTITLDCSANCTINLWVY